MAEMDHTNFITRLEFVEAVRRLDDADAELREAARELERVLRQDYEDKIASAVTQVGEKVEASHGMLKEDVGNIQSHLTWQDRLLVGTLLTFAATVGAFLTLHYGFHVG